MDGIAQSMQSFFKREPAVPDPLKFKDDEWRAVMDLIGDLDHLAIPGRQNPDTEDRIRDLVEGKVLDKPKKTILSDDADMTWLLGDLLQNRADGILRDLVSGKQTSMSKKDAIDLGTCYRAAIKCFRHAGGILPSTHR